MRALALSLLCALIVAPAAVASPVATSDAAYALQGRVFTDPLGGCQNLGSSPCDPNAEGNNPAVSFIGVNEFRDGLAFMNTKPEWQRYMEVLILDGKDGDGANPKDVVDADPSKMFPGDQLKPEFTPKPQNVSAGLPTTGLSRVKSDLTIIRVTDETVPDAGKKRMTLSLSIHGIERAGVEGGTRAMEDLVTAATAGNSDKPILPEAVRKDAPTFAQTLRNTIIYFTYPNPDGWRRGTIDTGGFSSSFQRYNGNGVDPNRDYIDIGYSYRGYSGGSEPETRAFKGFYRDVLGSGATFQAGDDLHGQPFADALSYTLLPHGQHDLAKDTRIRETAKTINRAQYEATKWNPWIKENDEVSEPQQDCLDSVAIGALCPQIFAQTWGSVYDTINYTTTGTLGDFFDSTAGLNADGIDNEMSFSHIDKQIRFEQDTEQLHVAGNKSIIFAHLADIIAPKTGSMDVPGPQGYVPNVRETRAETPSQPGAPAGTQPQADIDGTATPSSDPADQGTPAFAFTVERSATIFNGGLRVDATSPNIGGIGTGVVRLLVQCKFCDEHVGTKGDDEWVTVAEDFNQSPAYAQAGVTAAVNFPDPTYTDKNGQQQKVQWRALLQSSPLGFIDFQTLPAAIHIEFSSGPATDDGNNLGSAGDQAGDEAPVLKAYDVANTDFFDDLNRYIPEEADRFQKISPRRVITGGQTLDGLHTLVLADELLPGYKTGAGSLYTDAERQTWIDKLKAYAQGGGNLVLTDKALTALPDLGTGIGADKINLQKVYVGQIAVTRCKPAGAATYTGSGACADEERTLADPLMKNVNQPGSRFNDGFRRQMYEPTPIGFAIQNKTGGDLSASIQYDIDAKSFTDAGGRVAATSADAETDATSPVTNRVTVGEIPVGAKGGHIRVVGALLPQPSEAYDHPLGLTSYAVTYTGYIIVCNLLDANCKVENAPNRLIEAPVATPTPTPTPTTPDPPAICSSASGFESTSVTPVGRGLRLGFKRRLDNPVTIDVFRTSKGRRVFKRRVAHFAGRTEGLTWDGASAKGDGLYFVRFKTKGRKGNPDYRRYALKRTRGRFSKRGAHFRRASCDLLRSFSLRYPAFGGSTKRPLTIAYKLSSGGTVALRVARRGGQVVKRFAPRKAKALRGYRIRLAAAGLRRGDYVVTLTARRGSNTVRARLLTRRL